ncbi:hypothetical protein HYQ44_018915 [Verticillium longisporum]|nr:hypothetical protein HYQ44_018915 [Verticillium longisporum]
MYYTSKQARPSNCSSRLDIPYYYYMPSLLQKYQKPRCSTKSLDQSDLTPKHKDYFRLSSQSDRSAPSSSGAAAEPIPTPISNSMISRRSPLPSKYTSPSHEDTQRMHQTIRTVPSFETPSDSSTTSSPRNSAFSSSVNSNASAASMSSSQDRVSSVKLKQGNGGWANGNTMHDTSQRHDSPRRDDHSPDDQLAVGGMESPGPPGQAGWDSTIGKAGLGKTGRVINKLVSDNDSLKREIKIEQLRAEEAKQAAKLVEDKIERLISDYESRLLEANVNKTLLARKERQVESLSATVDQEKRRAVDALERERGWRDEMEKMRLTSTRQVDEAGAHAALMEGRYNAIASHWNNQGDEVKKAHLKLRSEIAGLVEERRRDDEKITTLRDLCDQQDGNIRELKRQRDEIEATFLAYKDEQEEALHSIKTNAAAREAEQEAMLKETREVLAKLKWALNVKENVAGAG